MKRRNRIIIAVVLVLSALLLYSLQLILFRRPEDTFYYLVEDLAFLPIQVIVVTLIISQLIEKRERQDKLRKLNVVIGVFFVDAGVKLLSLMHKEDSALSKALCINASWKEAEYKKALTDVSALELLARSDREQLGLIHVQLEEQKSFMIGLFNNPTLLEHDAFTDLLWALFHIADEMGSRNLDVLSEADAGHLANDITRAYRLLLIEWIKYMNHLRTAYPFLYTLALKNNPFLNTASDR